ncbi:MAG: TetR family transcriptional regulator [Microbacteriaceae bacterium]|jgi:AcrR family transcriptional regulator|nr:TetR family transcriptional regulator [Microbacteriaceae bacterium]
MTPTPDRTSLPEIVAAGRNIIEARGISGLTMQSVAERVGVRAPSLYKRISGRDALIALVAEAVAYDLAEALNAASTSSADPLAQLAALAHSLRAFAHANRDAYSLIFAPASEAARADPRSLAASAEPVFRVATQLAGSQDALVAARTITAWANGFITMELGGNFRLGGDVDAAFEFGIAKLGAALAHHESV